jgi:DNA-binding transcriptional LysR family regulator
VVTAVRAHPELAWLRIVVEVGDLPSAVRFVAAGLGVGVLPDAVPEPGCVRVPVLDGPPEWEMHVAVRRTPPPGAAARALQSALLEHVAARNQAPATG